MNLSRVRRLLDAIEANARKIEADLTAAISVTDVVPLRKLRAAAQAFVTDSTVAVREIRELDSELTPVQVPTRKSSVSFAAVGKILDKALEATKDEPPKDKR